MHIGENNVVTGMFTADGEEYGIEVIDNFLEKHNYAACSKSSKNPTLDCVFFYRWLLNAAE